MQITRRQAIKLAAAGVPGARLANAQSPSIASGPFEATRDSLKSYRVPEWFRDAKFGIWAHWGPQSAPEYGDWYARNMYIEGSRQYKYHLQKYGHPTKFGFKDVIPTWKAEKFDPAYLMSLYKKAGAKYFVSMGVHHDNFDLWNSKLNPWNAVSMGPKKDIVGLWRQAAMKEGLRFGVSEHLAVSYHWFQTSHGADKEGEFQGVPYDGADPKYASLYHETHDAPKDPWDPTGVPEKWKERYFLRIKDLIDQYQPDLMYTDGPIFFGNWGIALMAHHYNVIAGNHGGKVEAVWANKGKDDCVNGTCLLDLERGVVDRIWDDPWQTDTCIGDWHYNKEAKYKAPKIVIDMLVDIVSRNGNLLLNFPLPSNGMLDARELAILDEITKWMAVNSDAIYATRPWKTFGDGPALAAASAARRAGNDHHQAGAFNEAGRKPLTAADIRFTRKGGTLYAFAMGKPEGQVAIPALAQGGEYKVGRIRNVEMLGDRSKVNWRQDAGGLVIQTTTAPSEHAVVFKITGA
ncbi:MAG TPA: alpha-L-fucosidase [Bryobacteraceae bacterium]|nr:alpha-L-fucosidase [Bryobacteraceae bacterium]